MKKKDSDVACISLSSDKLAMFSATIALLCYQIKREHLSEWHAYVSTLYLMRRTTNGNCSDDGKSDRCKALQNGIKTMQADR